MIRLFLVLVSVCVPTTDTFSRDLNNLFFNVYRNDTNIGYHKVTIKESDQTTNVNIEIKFEVKFLGFNLYEYFHVNNEKWKHDRLFSIQAKTIKNNESLLCNISKNSDELFTTSSKNKIYYSIDSISSSYWNYKLVEGEVLNKMINTQDCSLIAIKVKKIGKEKIYNGDLEAIRYKIIGKESSGETLDIDIWYDNMKNWVKLIFIKDGSKIEYFLDEYHHEK